MKRLTYFGAIKFLSRYIGRHRKNFVMFYLGWFFDMLLGIVMPILFGIMIDEIVYHQNLDAFLRISLVFVVMSVFSCVLYFLIYAQHQYLMSMYVYDIQRDIFRHLHQSSATFLSDAKTGDMIATVQHYARECMHFVIRNIIHMINGCINLVLISLYIFLISPWIGLLMVVSVPVSVIINAHFGKKIRAYSDEQRNHYGGYVSYIYEVFTAIRDIRLLGTAKKVKGTIVERHRKMFAVNIKAGVSTLTAQNMIAGTNLVIQLAIFTLTAYLVSRGQMTIGLLTVVMSYFVALTSQVRQTSNSYLDAQNRVGYIQRIYDFMNAPTEEMWQGKAGLAVPQGEIIVKGVTFAYPKSSDVLRDFSLHIRPGEKIALCGKSGCGKTTFGYMLLGFYEAQKGSITIDGQSLNDCSLQSIREQIGMISQHVLLFDGSIKANMLLGKPRASDSEIISCLQKAGIWDHVSGLPSGMDTIIGTNGIGLSGGQKQRIAIARIYLRNPSILIFDEATSSLDSETERHIHEAWEKVLGGRTSIIIAHRQSSVMLCDRAAILENGRVIEIGTPQEMAHASTAFQQLFALREVSEGA
ncbi:MAG: ABC transporter ATP-binding protein [Paenibacillaceae bacterium]|nr:ABC transporter ATP-binding protein [Paenibacillaceae bacterium]